MTLQERTPQTGQPVNAGIFSSPGMYFERAVSELRFGRPVILKDADDVMAVMALDAASPQQLEQMATASGHDHSLFLSGQRAARMGAASTTGVVIPMTGLNFDTASRLAYHPGTRLPTAWRSAPKIMGLGEHLCEAAMLLPAMIVSPYTPAFAGCAELDVALMNTLDAERRAYRIIARTPVPLRDMGMCEFVVFRGGVAHRDQIAIIVGTPDFDRIVPVRLHSSCITGDLSGSLKCDCGDQLQNSLQSLHEAGGGVLLYLDQEGRGTGIGSKMRAYGYQNAGLDTIDADAELGFSADHRRYEAASAMLQGLGITKINLYTNNPAKAEALRRDGLIVARRTPVSGRVTDENRNYLQTKNARAGHMIENLSDG
ncbi:GTP cyclohydrolase II RibA [Falsirhodobacter sp. alg1]|uniref:GTP cyclohydrolase II RibA n=1 Tax=Falsirhodobacter sp. alg1 TaxID=1472418 RepID=UPI0005EF210E|nr:GTP cyclohydrolase II RibA [Falsirhodobacter sp. alg1]